MTRVATKVVVQGVEAQIEAEVFTEADAVEAAAVEEPWREAIHPKNGRLSPPKNANACIKLARTVEEKAVVADHIVVVAAAAAPLQALGIPQ